MLKKFEVASSVCLSDMINVQTGVTTHWLRWRPPLAAPFGQLGCIDHEINSSGIDVQTNPITIPYQGNRTAYGSLRRDMEDDRAIGGATHASIRYTHHVLDTGLGEFLWDWDGPCFRHAGSTDRACAAKYEDVIRRHIKIRVIDATCHILQAFKNQRRTLVTE